MHLHCSGAEVVSVYRIVTLVTLSRYKKFTPTVQELPCFVLQTQKVFHWQEQEVSWSNVSGRSIRNTLCSGMEVVPVQ